MATATARAITVAPPVEITLVLDGEEAQRLANLLFRIIDRPVLQGIEDALKQLGFSGFQGKAPRLVCADSYNHFYKFVE